MLCMCVYIYIYIHIHTSVCMHIYTSIYCFCIRTLLRKAPLGPGMQLILMIIKNMCNYFYIRNKRVLCCFTITNNYKLFGIAIL